MKKLTVNDARATEIFVLNEKNEVEKTNLYDHVILSIDETTSPRGVMPRLHIRENENTFEVWTWGAGGSNPKFMASFETEEEAEDFIFQHTFNYDFQNDDQRDTLFFASREEAEEILKERK